VQCNGRFTFYLLRRVGVGIGASMGPLAPSGAWRFLPIRGMSVEEAAITAVRGARRARGSGDGTVGTGHGTRALAVRACAGEAS
jgi:hypothetical protein